LTPGVRLGPYEVLSILGAGGMAEVYRARDTRLGRDIALKVVNEALNGDPDLVRRFEQEARIAGSLNHPNLVAVYDFGLHEGAPYFVTELLQGESLRHRLSRCRLGLQTALDWSAQMAHGLAAAHARGVVHRDVKPDNVFVGADGRVKLLDFGIAKLAERAREDGPHGLLDDTVTPSGGATRTGSILGSPGYMSPEQIRGEALDPRTDLFSLGAVIYEMLSGRRAFPGATLVESGNAILHADPEPLPPEVPPSVAEVVHRCLEKEPARRFQSASDLGFALDLLRSPTGSTRPPAAPPVRRGRRARSMLLALAAVTALVAAFAGGRHRASMAPSSIPEVEPITFRWGGISGARFLPDGRVVYSGHFEGRPGELFVSGNPEAQQLPGPSNVRLLSASSSGELAILLHPDWTGDRRGTLAQVPSVGGEPRELLDDVLFADWSPRGELAVVRREGVNTTLEFPRGHSLFRSAGWIGFPHFSREGDRIAFFHQPVGGGDTAEILVTDLMGHAQPWTQGVRFPNQLAWSADGREIWFVHAGAAGRHPNLLSAVGPGGARRDIYRSTSPFVLADVAKDGRALVANVTYREDLVYAGDGSGPQTLLSWSEENVPAALSAEGRLLFTITERVPNSEANLWVVLRSKNGGPAKRLAEGWAVDLSADGHWALVVSADDARLSAVPTGVGQVRSIPTSGLQIGGAGWMPDGKEVLVIGRPAGQDHARLYRLTGDASGPRSIGEATFGSGLLRISRDGRRAAALDENQRTVIISVLDGSAHPLPGGVAASVRPCGWTPDGSLWVSAAEQSRAGGRLLRLDPETGKLLEERTLRPDDPGGVSALTNVVVSPDGREVAFSYTRFVASLAILRGLEH
jgi:hypothetical protein